jgi:hypothetical protein
VADQLTDTAAIELASFLHGKHSQERTQLDSLRRYATGKQALPLVIPQDAPREVRELARISRINIIKIVLDSLVESLFVDNLRMTRTPEVAEGEPAGDPEDVTNDVWKAWQANRMDRAQSGLYRAVFQYGYGYAVFTRGDPYPVIRPMSARRMTAMYDDDDWPVYALERRRRTDAFRLYDEEYVYELGYDSEKKKFAALGVSQHGSPYCPVVKYSDVEDLDLDDEPEPHCLPAPGREGDVTRLVAGQVAPLMTLQDQTDVTSFALHGAQWYTAFRQRWVIGWTPANRAEKMSAGASQLWTFDADPDDMKLGEFNETNLDGFLKSREATLKYAATLSQTPVHELIGELVNLSAEALAAAEAGRDRKIDERKTGLGESHEQLAQGVGLLMGVDVPDDLEVVWRDNSARAFGAIVDGLGKIAAQLQVPPAELWDRIPGATRQDVRRWKTAQAEGDAMASLTGLLDRQAASPPEPGAPEPEIIVPPARRQRSVA